MDKKILLTAALLGISTSNDVLAMGDMTGMEKCKGVSPMAANSCGANSHACAGFAKQQFEKNEWIKVKEGTCDKIKKALEDEDLKNYIKQIAENANMYKRF
ncbi:MAG: DUF2282 domain-containing protein [Halobacteriovoraceae bacterium]|nr:DUF2282 domain-containing protein [Halobacteriovoraceae bacterium]